MSDDLTLRLRTAAALKWVPDDEPHVWPDGSRTLTLRRVKAGNAEVTRMEYDADGQERMASWTLPDYPASLGACAEVLDAIEAREWEWELSCSIGDNGEKRYYMGIEKARRGENYIIVVETVSEAEADSRTAAICLAFCEAVEASGARREAADNA